MSLTDLNALGRALRALASRSFEGGWLGPWLDDGRGLPVADPREERVARWLALAASLFFALVAAWEVAAPFGAGHFAAATSVGLAGENMLRFHTLLPVIEHPIGQPTVRDSYTHHPFGIFWTAAVFSALFGHHDFVCRLPAVLLSAATPPLLYALGRALFGPLPGAIAAAAFAVTPLALAYANFNSLEVPVIFGTLLASYGYVRSRQCGRRRWLVVTVLGLVYAVNSDWAAFIFAAGCLGLLFVRTFVLGKRLEAVDFRRSAQLFAWGSVLVTGVGIAYVLVLLDLGKLGELLAQGRARSAGAERTLAEALAGRRYWIELMFTPLAIVVGKLGTPVIVARALFKKSDLEALPLCLLAMALFQYLVFAEGADVHVFWPHYFAPYFALTLAASTATLGELGPRLIPRSRGLRERLSRWSPTVAAALGLLVPLLMARDALATLVYARKTGGRFNERGRFIQPDKDKVAALAYFGPRAVKSPVALDPNMRRSAWVPWVLGLPTKINGADHFKGDERYLIVDGRFANDGTLRSNAALAQTTVIGPFWIFDRKARGPAQAFGIERREPSLFERYFVSSTHALRSVTSDPFWTWEIRDHLLQAPNPTPSGQPHGVEQLRIAHNVALHRGDWERAEALRSELLKGVDRSAETLYADGTRLLGIRFESGASDVLTVYFESIGAADQRFYIRSQVEQRAAWSWVPADTLRWDVGLPTTLPREVWKPGYIYSSVTEILRRPGRERFTGTWVTTGRELPLLSKDGQADVTLLVLP